MPSHKVTADQLREQHGQWGEHPDHPLRDWQHEVENDYTRSGYWDWVANEIACAEGFAEEAPSEGSNEHRSGE